LKVREFLYTELRNDANSSLSILQDKLVGQLHELRFRLQVDYTVNVSHIRSEGLYYELVEDEPEDIKHLRKVIPGLENPPVIYIPPTLYSIADDMDFIIGLDERSLKSSRIELDNSFQPKHLADLIIRVLKEGRYCNSAYKKNIDSDINEFVDFILGIKPSNKIDINFIDQTNRARLNFARIFYYLKEGDFIKSNKGKIEEMLSEIFNISTRIFEDHNLKKIKKEMQTSNGVAYIVDDFLSSFKK
jgi:hypothetical protein